MRAGDKMASEMAWVLSTRSTNSILRLLTTANWGIKEYFQYVFYSKFN